MGSNAVQKFFMLALTIAVGVLFFIRVPQPQDEEIQRLKAQISLYETAIFELQQGATPTLSVLSVNVTEEAGEILQQDVPPGATNSFVVPTATTFISPEMATSTSAPIIQEGVPAVIEAVMSLSVDNMGCANDPRTVYTNFETMYGVGRFINMREGDRITARFFYNENSSLIYEDTFVVTEAGDFCRWWDLLPDEVGWEVGSYTMSLQINQDPPMVVDYTIGILSDGSTATPGQ